MPDASYYLNSTPQLQSSLGAPAPSKSSGGFSVFGWHPSLPNLGGITAVKQLASGFIGLPESVLHLASEVNKGNFEDANPLDPNSTLGKYAYGFGHGVEDVATSVAGAAGVPFTKYNLGDQVVAPLLKSVNDALPQQQDAHGNDIAFKPSTFWQRPGGPIAGVVQDLSTVAAVATPVARGLTSSAAEAATASEAAAEAASAGTGTAEAAQLAADRAAAAAHAAEIAKNFAHPYQYLGAKASDLIGAAHNAALPPVSETLPSSETPAELLAQQDAKPTMDIQQLGAQLRELQSTETAAAQAVTAEPPKTVTLYRGSDFPEAVGNQGSWWSSEPPVGRGGYAHWQTTELPTTRLDELKQAAQEAGRRGEGQPRPQDVFLDPNHPANADLFNNAKEVPLGSEPGAKQLKIEDRLLAEGETGNVQPTESVRPAAAHAEGEQAIRDAEAAAREGTPVSSVAERVAARLAQPAPAWAQRITNVLPDSVNRVLGALAEPIARHQVQAVARDLARYVEVSQRQARTSDFVTQAEQAAQQLVSSIGVDRREASRMIGEQISAINDATAFVDEFVKSGGDPQLTQAMHEVALRGYSGVTDEVRAKLGPEASAQLDAQINQAVQAWRDESAKRFNTLLASSHGARGLEDAVLQTDDPHMNAGQVKAYRQAQAELRLEEALRARMPQEHLANEARAQRATLLSEKANAEAEALRAKVGVFERTAETLHDSIPLALRAENIDEAVNTIMTSILNEGGITYDVGRNVGALPHEGVVVGIANQFDMPLEQFLAQGPDAIRKALTSPLNPDGDPYGPGVWAGPDARFGAWQHQGPDGRQWVSSEISMSTWGGKPLSQWQATVLGEAHGQEAIFDATNGVDIPLSKQRDVQNLMALYAADSLQPNSPFARFASQLDKTDRQVAGLPASATDDALRLYATWDYALGQANPEWQHGDFFKQAAVGYGRAEPRSAALLAQTVLGLSTQEGVETALAHLDARSVSDSLAWYYDSHDYIESAYGGKTMTLLNGEQRPATDVFYDLLAVTSVMASPKQNLGRAMMALSNTEDFLHSRKDARAAAQSLMDKLERKAPGVEDFNGTKLSTRFLTPEVRKITNQTSMVNAPKYNVWDILTGKLKLDQATNADIAKLPEWWIGTAKSISAQNMPRAHVIDTMDRLGITGPAADAYKTWAGEHADVANLREQLKTVKANAKSAGFKPADEVAALLDGSPYKTQAELERAYKASAATEKTLLEDPGVARAHDQALTEFQGSTALAKLRSFRDNLSNPHESLAVTLDSVMAKMYGFSSQDWAGGGTYATHANEIRAAADALSARFGREVKPHEVQALLWVYTKQEVGRQDFGRLLAHHDMAQGALESMDKALQNGQPVNPRSFDPLADYWDEELGYSKKALDQRQTRTYLEKQLKARGKLDPEQQAELDALRPLDLRNHVKSTQVLTTPNRADLSALPEDSAQYGYEERRMIPYDAKELTGKETQYGNYVAVRSEIQQAIAGGDIPEARRLLTSYVTKQRRSIMGDVGGSFQDVGEETRLSEGDSAAIAERNLQNARHVPAPTPWRSNFIAPLSARYNRQFGLPEPAGLDLGAQVIPERTAAVAKAVEDILQRTSEGKITPEETAQAATAYRALQAEIDQQYEYMTKTLGLHVDYVAPEDEYGLGTLGDSAQPNMADAHAQLVADIRNNNHLKIRSTALAGDTPNHFMSEYAPDGIQYNDKLRAVHDFFGHAQASNDFGRHGENVAQQLHLQMMSEDAKAAAITEFRAQTAYLIEHGDFPDSRLASLLPEEMRQPDYMQRGNLNELHQQFHGTLRGATMLDPGADGRLQMRMFQDAALDTLAHEGGHLLRQMLPADELAQVLDHYPHITDATLTAERTASEEKFVADMMMYVRQHATQGDTGPLPDVFRRIAATLEEQHAAMLDGTYRRSLSPDVASFWQRMFHPGLEHPDKIVDPINIRRVTSLAGAETKQFPWESDAQFAQRARQYGEARARVETAQFKAQLMARTAAKADATARRMWAVYNNEPGKIEAEANRLHTHAMNVLDKLGRQLEDPKTGQVPQAFKPMWEGFQALHAQAAIDPRLAEMLDEIPSTFSAALQAAAEHGFDPQYVPDLTWERAQRLLFGHIQLGAGDRNAVVSGMRKENVGVLNRAGLADRSIEALAAGTVDATHELYSNTLVQFVQENYARPLTPGASIPAGWKPWDPARDYLLTGTDKRGAFVATNAKYIVPKGVDDALTSMTKRYDHWTFHTLSKVTRPWVTYNLTLSPKWYLHIFISNIIRGLAEGTTLHDWATSVKQWKTGTLPDEVYGHSIAGMMADGGHTLLGQTVADARKTDGMRAAVREVQGRVAKVHDVVDEVSRGAVFEHTLRTTGSRSQALTRSYEAMVDYGALSPFERSAVRSLIPFYAFYKGMVKLLARFPADHPAATSALLLAGKIHDEYLQDRLGGKLPDAYQGLANIGGIHNFSILDPFINPVHLIDIHNVNTTLNPFVDIALRTAYNAAEPGTGQPGMTATGQKVTQVNPLAALGSEFAQAPLNRAIGGAGFGGDVFGKTPSVAGAIGQYLGVPTTPDVAKIQATVQKTLGTLPKKGEPGYVPPARKASSSKHVRHAFARIRGPRKPRKPRLPII